MSLTKGYSGKNLYDSTAAAAHSTHYQNTCNNNTSVSVSYNNNPWMKERAMIRLGCTGMKSYYQKSEEKRLARLKSIKSVISSKSYNKLSTSVEKKLKTSNVNNNHHHHGNYMNINNTSLIGKGKGKTHNNNGKNGLTTINNLREVTSSRKGQLLNCSQSQTVHHQNPLNQNQMDMDMINNVDYLLSGDIQLSNENPKVIAEKGIDPTFLPYYATANAVNAMPNFLQQQNNDNIYNGHQHHHHHYHHQPQHSLEKKFLLQQQLKQQQQQQNHTTHSSVPNFDPTLMMNEQDLTNHYHYRNSTIVSVESKVKQQPQQPDSPLKKALQGIESVMKDKSPLRSFYKKNNKSPQKKGAPKLKLSPLKKKKGYDKNSSTSIMNHNQNESIEEINLKPIPTKMNANMNHTHNVNKNSADDVNLNLYSQFEDFYNASEFKIYDGNLVNVTTNRSMSSNTHNNQTMPKTRSILDGRPQDNVGPDFYIPSNESCHGRSRIQQSHTTETVSSTGGHQHNQLMDPFKEQMHSSFNKNMLNKTSGVASFQPGSVSASSYTSLHAPANLGKSFSSSPSMNEAEQQRVHTSLSTTENSNPIQYNGNDNHIMEQYIPAKKQNTFNHQSIPSSESLVRYGSAVGVGAGVGVGGCYPSSSHSYQTLPGSFLPNNMVLYGKIPNINDIPTNEKQLPFKEDDCIIINTEELQQTCDINNSSSGQPSAISAPTTTTAISPPIVLNSMYPQTYQPSSIPFDVDQQYIPQSFSPSRGQGISILGLEQESQLSTFGREGYISQQPNSSSYDIPDDETKVFSSPKKKSNKLKNSRVNLKCTKDGEKEIFGGIEKKDSKAFGSGLNVFQQAYHKYQHERKQTLDRQREIKAEKEARKQRLLAKIKSNKSNGKDQFHDTSKQKKSNLQSNMDFLMKLNRKKVEQSPNKQVINSTMLSPLRPKDLIGVSKPSIPNSIPHQPTTNPLSYHEVNNNDNSEIVPFPFPTPSSGKGYYHNNIQKFSPENIENNGEEEATYISTNNQMDQSKESIKRKRSNKRLTLLDRFNMKINMQKQSSSLHSNLGVKVMGNDGTLKSVDNGKESKMRIHKFKKNQTLIKKREKEIDFTIVPRHKPFQKVGVCGTLKTHNRGNIVENSITTTRKGQISLSGPDQTNNCKIQTVSNRKKKGDKDTKDSNNKGSQGNLANNLVNQFLQLNGEEKKRVLESLNLTCDKDAKNNICEPFSSPIRRSSVASDGNKVLSTIFSSPIFQAQTHTCDKNENISSQFEQYLTTKDEMFVQQKEQQQESNSCYNDDEVESVHNLPPFMPLQLTFHDTKYKEKNGRYSSFLNDTNLKYHGNVYEAESAANKVSRNNLKDKNHHCNLSGDNIISQESNMPPFVPLQLEEFKSISLPTEAEIQREEEEEEKERLTFLENSYQEALKKPKVNEGNQILNPSQKESCSIQEIKEDSKDDEQETIAIPSQENETQEVHQKVDKKNVSCNVSNVTSQNGSKGIESLSGETTIEDNAQEKEKDFFKSNLKIDNIYDQNDNVADNVNTTSNIFKEPENSKPVCSTNFEQSKEEHEEVQMLLNKLQIEATSHHNIDNNKSSEVEIPQYVAPASADSFSSSISLGGNLDSISEVQDNDHDEKNDLPLNVTLDSGSKVQDNNTLEKSPLNSDDNRCGIERRSGNEKEAGFALYNCYNYYDKYITTHQKEDASAETDEEMYTHDKFEDDEEGENILVEHAKEEEEQVIETLYKTDQEMICSPQISSPVEKVVAVVEEEVIEDVQDDFLQSQENQTDQQDEERGWHGRIYQKDGTYRATEKPDRKDRTVYEDIQEELE